MASSENLASLDPWLFRPAFPDSWISEAYARDTESLTKALQKSLCGSAANANATAAVAAFAANGNSGSNFSSPVSLSETFASDAFNPFVNLINPVSTETASPTPTASNVSGASDPETAPKRQRNSVPGPTGGKVTKRKSRASKRSQTTFITADPANFRQMVQQVTGVRLSSSQMPMVPVLKPEPQRLGSRLQGTPGAGCLPTLDTSAFLLDHQQPQVVIGSSSTSGSVSVPVAGSRPIQIPQQVAADGSAVGGSLGGGIDFDTFSSFPTLESWKVM